MASAHCLSLPQRIQSLLHRFQRVAYRCRTIPQDPAFKLYVGNIRRGRPAVSWLYSIMRRFALSTDASAVANRPPPTPLSSAGPSCTEKAQERGAVPRAPSVLLALSYLPPRHRTQRWPRTMYSAAPSGSAARLCRSSSVGSNPCW